MARNTPPQKNPARAAHTAISSPPPPRSLLISPPPKKKKKILQEALLPEYFVSNPGDRVADDWLSVNMVKTEFIHWVTNVSAVNTGKNEMNEMKTLHGKGETTFNSHLSLDDRSSDHSRQNDNSY